MRRHFCTDISLLSVSVCLGETLHDRSISSCFEGENAVPL